MFKIRYTKTGLTLIELLISVMLISILLGAVWIIYSTGFEVFHNQLNRYDIKDQSALAFITMTNEFHEVSSITAATATSITFTADTNDDGIDETIQYTWSGASGAPLNRVVGTASTQLVRSVNNPPPLSTNPLFYYYGVDNADLGTAPTVSQVRLMLIDLTTQNGDETFHLRTKIQLRTI